MNPQRYYDKVGELGKHQGDALRFEQTLPHILRKGTLLDAGCGEGYWLDFLRDRTELTLIGSDVSPVRLDAAKKRLSGSGVTFYVEDIQALQPKPVLIGQVTALEVLEHIPDWKSGLSHLARIALHRVVVTVPYSEILKYEICGNCGERANLYGHLHSFTKSDFEGAEVSGELKFERLRPAFGLEHYIKRVIRGMINRSKAWISTSSEKSHSLYTICPNCYEKVPYEKYIERACQRLVRIITRQPEYLLVQINK